jgi:hypothetical protein
VSEDRLFEVPDQPPPEKLSPFGSAAPGDRAVVYTCQPGDEYGWVTDSVWFDDINEPVTVKRQVWQLVEETEVVFHPYHELCSKCEGEGEIVLPPVSPTGEDTDGHPVPCKACDGFGLHPAAGQMETL